MHTVHCKAFVEKAIYEFRCRSHLSRSLPMEGGPHAFPLKEVNARRSRPLSICRVHSCRIRKGLSKPSCTSGGVRFQIQDFRHLVRTGHCHRLYCTQHNPKDGLSADQVCTPGTLAREEIMPLEKIPPRLGILLLCVRVTDPHSVQVQLGLVHQASQHHLVSPELREGVWDTGVVK